MRGGVALFVAIFFLVGDGVGEEKGAFSAVKEIPDRFFQVQGSNGFFWQAVQNGAVTSGETQYLQSGLNLLVDGKNFAPSSARVREPAAEVPGAVEWTQKRDGLTIQRTMVFDRDRSAVQVSDVFQNTSGKERRLTVDLRTTYPFGWESLHGQDGGLLGRDPVLALGEDDVGLVVHFSTAQGRHDTMIVAGPVGEGLVRPKLIASANRRELTLRYEFAIPAGATRSLLHFLGQVMIPDMAKADEVFSDFFRSGRIVRPALGKEGAKAVVNFPEGAFAEDSAAPEKAGALVALNEFLDQLGAYRRASDLLWLSVTSQMTGAISPDAVVVIQGSVGEPKKLGIKEVAAIRGGSGIDRPGRVYLRNGSVMTGDVSAEKLRFQADGESEGQVLDASAMHLLLTKTDAGDGASPKGTVGFLELVDGEVILLSGAAEKIPVVASWGRMELPFSALREIRYVREPAPSYRVLAADGSRFSVFLPAGQMALSVVGGKKREVSLRSISAFWSADVTSAGALRGEESWMEFAELPDTLPVKQGFLLRGNQLVAGGFAEAALHVRTDGPVIRLETEQIRSLQRVFGGNPVTDGAANRYAVVLKNGESLEGEIADEFLTMLREGEQIRIPFDQLFSYRAL